MKPWKMFLAALVISILGSFTQAATTPNVAGRWVFVVTSGDTPYQLSYYQTGYETDLTQSGKNISAIYNNVEATGDSSACDSISYGNTTVSGTVNGNAVVVTFVTNTSETSTPNLFNYVFTGTLNTTGTLTKITGTYTTNVNSTCSNGSGNFEATYYPPFTGVQYTGALDAVNTNDGGPSSIPVTINNMKVAADNYSLTGTIVLGSALTDGHGNSCFANSTLTFTPSSTVWFDEVTGEIVDIAATDSLGRTLMMEGYPIGRDGGSATLGYFDVPNRPNFVSYVTTTDTSSLGTNNIIQVFYTIAGGPCDGFGGGDAPLQAVPNTGKHGKHEHHKHDKN